MSRRKAVTKAIATRYTPADKAAPTRCPPQASPHFIRSTTADPAPRCDLQPAQVGAKLDRVIASLSGSRF